MTRWKAWSRPGRRLAGSGLEVIPAVEISTEHAGKELHLLAYFVSLEEGPLTFALTRLRQQRRQRFHEMVERLRKAGVSLDTVRCRRGRNRMPWAGVTWPSCWCARESRHRVRGVPALPARRRPGGCAQAIAAT